MAPYARYRAPAESGSKLVVPRWDELSGLVSSNRAWRADADVEIAGQSLAEFAASARGELLSRAKNYVAGYSAAHSGDLDEGIGEKPLILTGHQPEMVHPGVWVKNFAAAALARSLGGTALNLVIDADACRGTTIRVPSGTIESPQFGSVEFDVPGEVVPWEERSVLDAPCWDSFPRRVRDATSKLLEDRMLDQWWSLATDRARTTGRIGAGLAQARHLAELQWGLQNLELPQSEMCRSDAFRRFVCHFLRELPRFVDAYNGVLVEYRRAHHIRNHAHPASNLEHSGEWLQAPLWCWTSAEPRRRAVFVRRHGGRLMVSDLHSFERRLPLGEEPAASAAVAELARWEAEGLKLRSRALITTMFARLAVADLFIHGIGGAKYDEVTDAIAEHFFHTVPPRYATISGTLRLPIAQARSRGAGVSKLNQTLRELDYHPERFIDAGSNGPDQAAGGLIEEKLRWVRMPKTPGNAAARHEAIVAANRALQPYVAARRNRLETELIHASARQRSGRVLDSREYAFCLFSQEHLRHFLLDFATDAL